MELGTRCANYEYLQIEEEASDNYLGGFFRRGEDVKALDDYLGGFFKREEDGKAPDNYLGGFFKRGAE